MTLPDLTESEFNLILTALGQRPYVEVATLLDKIVTHVRAQKTPQPVTISEPVA